jgi:hypothetical protein
MVGLPITLSEIAPRISAGAFILNSGLGKRNVPDEAAAGMHGFAAGTYPFLKSVPPQQFVKLLSTSEIILGAALLTPFVPTAVAGAALTVFSGGLFGLYLKTPGIRKALSSRPSRGWPWRRTAGWSASASASSPAGSWSASRGSP